MGKDPGEIYRSDPEHDPWEKMEWEKCISAKGSELNIPARKMGALPKSRVGSIESGRASKSQRIRVCGPFLKTSNKTKTTQNK